MVLVRLVPMLGVEAATGEGAHGADGSSWAWGRGTKMTKLDHATNNWLDFTYRDATMIRCKRIWLQEE
jgi:hypothetical protein